ncbi:MAG: hypothetical protein AB1733_19270 [Thermodesulfobacteriota bacterium]
MEQHKQIPFHAVIASENRRALNFVLMANDIVADTKRWNVPRECEVARTPESLAAVVERLVHHGDHIIFVDKLFDPGVKTPRWREILCAFIALVTYRDGRPPVLEYHTMMDESAFSAASDQGRQEIQEHFESWLADNLPSGVEITVFLWSEDFARKRVHARCVLTERGGMRIDAGLDRVTDDHMTDVMLMDDTLYAQRWSMLCEASDLFRNDRSRFLAESERKGWVHAAVIKGKDERSHE